MKMTLEARKNHWEQIRSMRHNEKKTLAQIGEKFGITRERVRQILKYLGTDGRIELPKKPKTYYHLTCKNCGTSFEKIKKEMLFCSWNCYLQNLKENPHGRKYMNSPRRKDYQSFREYNNARSRWHYYNVQKKQPEN